MEEAFFVICDERVQPSAVSGGEFQFVIGFAASREHEFHSFRISHSASGSKVQPVSLNRLELFAVQPGGTRVGGQPREEPVRTVPSQAYQSAGRRSVSRQVVSAVPTASELAFALPAAGRREARYGRQLLEGDARVFIAGLDRAVEGLPVEQVDIRERRLQQHIGELALRPLARRAVDHAGVHQDLKNIDAAFAEAAIGADIAADHEARRVALHDIDRQIVDGGAIDQYAVAVKHRRHDAGNGDRGAQAREPADLSDARAAGRW